MKQPLVKVEEKIDRFVGRRTQSPDPWQAGMQIGYAEAAKDVVIREVGGVPIPLASPKLLWQMKAVTHREKDAGDLFFQREWFAKRGEPPPKV